MSGVITIKIADRAKQCGIKTAYQLQKALDVSPSMAAKLWRGQFKMIGIETLNRLCSLLECEPHQILVYTEKPTV